MNMSYRPSWALLSFLIALFIVFIFYLTLNSTHQTPPSSPKEEGKGSPKQVSESQIKKEQLIDYFSKDLGFKFKREYRDLKGNMIADYFLGNWDAGPSVWLSVIYNSYNCKVKEVTMLISPFNSVNNKNLIYLSRLLEKVAPDIQNRDHLVKKGVAEALQKNRTMLTVGEKKFVFSYLKDPVVKSDNSLIFGYNLTTTSE
jgi:hypothetical protein